MTSELQDQEGSVVFAGPDAYQARLCTQDNEDLYDLVTGQSDDPDRVRVRDFCLDGAVC
jgi:hypothetical protein